MSFSRCSFARLYAAVMGNLPTLALMALCLLGTPSQGVAQGCVTRQQARQLFEQGQAIPFPEALRRAGLSRNQLAGDPQLCRGGGGYVYRVRIVQNGQVQAVNIPAN
jgi:hypothetical protein